MDRQIGVRWNSAFSRLGPLADANIPGHSCSAAFSPYDGNSDKTLAVPMMLVGVKKDLLPPEDTHKTRRYSILDGRDMCADTVVCSFRFILPMKLLSDLNLTDCVNTLAVHVMPLAPVLLLAGRISGRLVYNHLLTIRGSMHRGPTSLDFLGCKIFAETRPPHKFAWGCSARTAQSQRQEDRIGLQWRFSFKLHS
jgi:hypothetical protein